MPIRAERSVDQDLLEDASAAIENALREQGYRAARAPYTRAETAGEMLVTFAIARGPLHRIESVETAGNARVTALDLAPLLQIKAGDPFVEARVGLVGAAITELYRVRGFASGRGQAQHPGACRRPPRSTSPIGRSRFATRSSKDRNRSSAAWWSRASPRSRPRSCRR